MAPEHQVLLIRINRQYRPSMTWNEILFSDSSLVAGESSSRRELPLGIRSLRGSRSRYLENGLMAPTKRREIRVDPRRRGRWAFRGKHDRALEKRYLNGDLARGIWVEQERKTRSVTALLTVLRTHGWLTTVATTRAASEPSQGSLGYAQLRSRQRYQSAPEQVFYPGWDATERRPHCLTNRASSTLAQRPADCGAVGHAGRGCCVPDQSHPTARC